MSIRLNGDVITLVSTSRLRNSTTTTPDAPTKPITKPLPKPAPLPPPDDKPMPATPSPGYEPDDDPGGPNRCPGPCTVPP